MATAAKKTYITPEEYLARERLAEFKSEYHDGQVYAMSGASRPHNLIAGNLFFSIGSEIRHRQCELYIADMRVRVGPADNYVYPDIAVVCGEPEFVDGEFDTLLNPTVILEVLSPSTEGWDRGGKFDAYRGLGSLRDYVLVSQDKVLVEHHSRRGEQWHPTVLRALEDILHLDSIGCEVSLSEVYAKIPFEPGDAAPGA